MAHMTDMEIKACRLVEVALCYLSWLYTGCSHHVCLQDTWHSAGNPVPILCSSVPPYVRNSEGETGYSRL